jgi:hypothetical protein
MTEIPTPDAQAAVCSKVEDYCRRYCVSPGFEISEVYDVETDWTKKNYQHRGDKDYGCCVFYSASNELLYIGGTFWGSIGSRISTYFKKDQTRAIPNTGWKDPIRYIQTIRVHEAHEAPSLEQYLITKLQPCNNARGIRKVPP